MRILIDECIDRRLRDFLAGHECQTARYAGFGGLENGALLTAAENAKFDVLLTVDRGIEFQQDLRHRNIAILIVYAKSIRLKDLLPHVATCLAGLESIQPGKSSELAVRRLDYTGSSLSLCSDSVPRAPLLLSPAPGGVGPRNVTASLSQNRT